MRTLLRRLNRASQVLLLAFAGLGALALHQWLDYAPWARHYYRTAFDDAYGFPVYVNEVDFWPDGAPTRGASAGIFYPSGAAGIDSAGGRPDTPTGTWGAGGVGGEPSLLPLPSAVAVNYTSVAEGRSYGGRVPLPRARFDSLLTQLAARPQLYYSFYAYPGRQPGFELLAGLGPGGRVVMWLKGEAYQAELTRARVPACPTTWPKAPRADPSAPFDSGPPVPAHNFAELRRQVGGAERARLDSLPPAAPALLDSLARRYVYRLRVLGAPTPDTLDAHFLDAEQQPLLAPAGNAGRLHRALPDYLTYKLASADSLTYYRVLFEFRETRRAFAQVQQACAPGEVPELLLLPARRRVQLRCRRRAVVLRQAEYRGPS